MARIAFLGLGDMGTPMARRLLRAGHDLVIWNRSPERTIALARDGAADLDFSAVVATIAETRLSAIDHS